MKIGLLFPSETERNPILDHIEIVEEKKFSGLDFIRSKIFDHDLVIVVSGICKVNAAIASQLLIDKFDVDLIINTGVCGGLDHRTKLFDTVISEKVYYHDVEKQFISEEIPYIEDGCFMADKRLVELSKKIRSEESKIKIGTTICGEQFITDQERLDLIDRYDALGVDMETGAVAHVCYVNKVAFIAIRTITDDADHSGIEFFRENVKKASKIAVKVTVDLLKML
ncbi:MAG: 5'-methylthioadenosine/S-adenosylhomocysteine nucleosidase [Tissierellia bacterium]|nr:5'-methylthioadenosine/S-adenosylhomocysteine nucleosidase [Tissierellia bacterium]